jgi:hypothetical protein
MRLQTYGLMRLAFLLIGFHDVVQKIIFGKWVIQDLAGHAVRFFMIMETILKEVPQERQERMETDSLKYGI